MRHREDLNVVAISELTHGQITDVQLDATKTWKIDVRDV
jgi:hypothetical protein